MIKNQVIPSYIAAFISFLGGIFFLVQSWMYAHQQASVLDEGLYLYKGFLFASGQYRPFQDYGPWTNHMPLSFLIPGFVQVIFGPGLRTGRYFAIALGMLIILGLWILARRLGGSWWGLVAVWALALNPALIKIFSVMASQGLVACMVIWVLVFVVGKTRPGWQIIVGAFLTGLIPLTRVNLTPVLPFVIIYIFWEHGRRAGLSAIGISLVTFFAIHAIFWPGILRMWAPWFPESLTPFLNPWRRPPGVSAAWNPSMDFSSRLLSFIQGARFHFVSLLGALGIILVWSPRKAWRNLVQFRATVLAFGLFVVLFGLHAWAALGQDYCVFCFPVYLSFFSLIGIILIVVSFNSWYTNFSKARYRFFSLLILLLFTGVGYSLFNEIGATFIKQPTVRQILLTEVPRVDGFSFAQGRIELWGLIGNKFGIGYEKVVQETQYWLRVIFSTLLGFGVGLIVLFLGWLSAKLPIPNPAISPVSRVYIIVIVAGMLLSPTVALGGGYRNYDCGGDIIRAYEEAGKQLQVLIPNGSRVYWGTGESPVPLLYLKNIEIYPPQLNGVYSFRHGGDPDSLLKFGVWNQILAEKWSTEADVILVNGSVYKNNSQTWLAGILEAGDFDELAPTIPVHPCDKNSQIHLFMRKFEIQ
jgi:hypothetical protein